jgi:hypothetical protein
MRRRKEMDWPQFAEAMRKLYALDGQEIDPKEIMSSSFYKVFDTREEAIRDSRVRAYKKGEGVDVDGEKLDQLIEDLVDDLLDGI